MTTGFIGRGKIDSFQEKTANFNLTAGDKFIVNSATRRDGLLPTADAIVGSTIEVALGSDATGGWKITQGVGQSIILPDGTSTTTGSGGFVQSESTDAQVMLVCTVADTTWRLINLGGKISDQTGNFFGESTAADANTVVRRDANARFKAAASSAADDVVIRSEVDTGGAFETGTPIEKAFGTSAGAWVKEGPLLWGHSAQTSFNDNGAFVRIPANASTFFVSGGVTAPYVAVANTGTSDAPDGTVMEFVAVISTSTFAGLAANQLVAFGIGDAPVPGNSAGDYMDKTNTRRRVSVGIDSSGDIFVVTANGTTATATDTGINYVAGTKIRIKIVFTKGTDVVVTVDDNTPTTVTATLPTRIATFACGYGGSFTSGSPLIDYYGGFWRITGV